MPEEKTETTGTNETDTKEKTGTQETVTEKAKESGNTQEQISIEEYQALKKENEGLKNQKLKAEKEKEETERKDLEEKEKYKELYEKEQEKSNKKDEALKEKELKLLAQKHGMHDPDDILSEGIRKQFQYNESLEVINDAEVMKELKEKKSYLFNTEGPPTVPKTDSTKPNVLSGGKVFTTQQIKEMSNEEFKKNKEEIFKQMNAGLIK